MITLNLREHRDVRFITADNEPDFNGVTFMRLNYYIHESECEPELLDDNNDPEVWGRGMPYGFTAIKSFGIGVSKTQESNFEEKYVGDVTTNKSKAREIIRMLAENHVTPCCLRDALEDIIVEI